MRNWSNRDCVSAKSLGIASDNLKRYITALIVREQPSLLKRSERGEVVQAMSSQTVFKPPVVTNSTEIPLKPTQLHFNEAFRNTVTRSEAENLTKCAFSPDAELVDYHLRPYSEEKLGFLGSHLCLIITARRSGCDEFEKRSFFVKSIPYNIPNQAIYVEEKGVFEKEEKFFRYLVPLMTDNFKIESWAPRCYLTKDSAIVYEDMKLRGFTNRSKFFDLKTLRAAVACVARFHASSLLAEEKLNGKSIHDLYPEILRESEYKQTGRSKTWFAVAINLVVSIADQHGYYSSNIRRASECIFDAILPSKTKRNVVSHGDLWGSNLIFDGEDRCNLVDFQLLRYAPLAHDVIRLIYLTSRRELRREHEAQLLEHYYVTLRKTLVDNAFKGVMPSYEELLLGVEEQRLGAVVTVAVDHPTVMMDGKMAATIMDDPTTYEAFFFKDRKPFVDKIMSVDPEFERVVKAAVQELAEMSLIVDSLPRPT
ncbi:uncharacterized protein LOC103316378 [Nasonia vitripennis]|uniref:CHK kinase-like domain-containing protein n=1 Tax=Nasonia vitripennis TaxID=7425 RepID=A0A7M7H5J1_NASVI|nr:uncharacterized protein LOC103316378 [Nasonia vitripennis]